MRIRIAGRHPFVSQSKKKWLLWVMSTLGVSGTLLVMLFLLLGITLMGMLIASSEATYKGMPLRNIEQLDFPLPLLTIFLQAQNGAVSWSQLAAISKVNTDFGRHAASNGGIGFLGFPDSLWRQIAVDGDGDGTLDPESPDDAIFSLATAFSRSSSSFRDTLASFQMGEAQFAEVKEMDRRYSSSVLLSAGWLWPLVGYYQISSPYGMRSDPFAGQTEFHDGMDLPAPEGTPVLAIRDGFVSIASNDFGGYGYYIRLSHLNGIESFYGHLSVIGVEEGQFVHQGQIIGAVGSTGRSTGPHLHVGMMQNGQSIDPMKQWFP